MDDLTIGRNYQELANAIIIYAVYDLRCYYRTYLRNPYDNVAKGKIRELTMFFSSEYFKLLSDVDGEVLVNDIVVSMKKDPDQKIRRATYVQSWERLHREKKNGNN